MAIVAFYRRRLPGFFRPLLPVQLLCNVLPYHRCFLWQAYALQTDNLALLSDLRLALAVLSWLLSHQLPQSLTQACKTLHETVA
jgi:hypothetical protein